MNHFKTLSAALGSATVLHAQVLSPISDFSDETKPNCGFVSVASAGIAAPETAALNSDVGSFDPAEGPATPLHDDGSHVNPGSSLPALGDAPGFATESLTLEIDAQRSHLDLAPAVFDGIEFSPGQPQGIGGLRASVAGTILIERTAAGVRMLPGSRLIMGDGGTWTPGRYTANPENPREFNPSPAPACFGYRFTSPFEFLVSARDLVFELTSEAAHPIDGVSFSSSNLNVTVAAGVGHLTLGNPPVSDLTTYPPTLTTEAGPGRWSEGVDRGVEMNLPLAFAWNIEGGLLLRSVYTGLVVARTKTTTAEPPRLLAAISEGGLQLSWSAPSPSNGWRLESAATLGDSWDPVIAEIVHHEGVARVNVPVSTFSALFRLVPGE